MPKYANGEYTLGAFLTTDSDDRREVVASQPIALDNHGFVKIAHVPGNRSEVGTHTEGLTFYGGPSTAEGNVNTFHACPVAYDGTEVGKMQLGTVVTDTEQNPIADANRATFRDPGGGSFYPNIEAPFTWTISTAHSRTNNYLVENVPGETEHWIINDGIITDPNGRDVTATFREGGEMAKLGPLHFDFKAPTISENSEVVIVAHNAASSTWTSTTARHYRDSGGQSSRRFRITGMDDMGVGHVYGTTSMIAVGDYSAGRNADSNPDTDFTPLEGLENVTFINQLPEEDPSVDGVADGGGIDTYVAELQSLADRLGNGRWLGGGRIRTATTFGVDRTPPVISRERPAESLVLGPSNELFFEIEDPRLGTGEDGSDVRPTVYAWAGDSRYWVTSRHYWSSTPSTAGGSVTVDVDPTGNARFEREESHTVYVRALDVVGNATSTSFTFVRDQTAPALSLSAVPSNFGSTTAKSVSVTVAGTLSDATEIRRVFLSIHAGDTCAADSDPLPGSQVSGPVRRLDNETNKIEFSEVFTVKQGDDAGVTSYCFFLKAEDDARDADDRATANVYSDQISTFSVGWPAGPPPPPPGPTFEFHPAGAATMLDSLRVAEAATSDNTYRVTLKDAPSGATYPLEMTIDAPATVTTAMVSAANSSNTTGFENATDTVTVTVTTRHDLNIVSEPRSLTHKAKDFDNTDFLVRVLDDDFEISVSPSSIRENAAAQNAVVTVKAGLGADITSDVSVTLGAETGTTEAADIASGSEGTATVTVSATTRMGVDTVSVDAVDDAVQDEENEAIALTATSSEQGVYVKPARIMILDDDPDFTLSANVTEVSEDAGTVTVTLTATTTEAVGGIVNFSLALGGTATGAGTDYTANPSPVVLQIDGGGTSATATVTLTIEDDAADEANETIIFSDADGAEVTGDKTYTISSFTVTIMDNDDA
ncbi:MAG: hypothetical protein F4X12_12115 [Acidobacteriia bacterium]|nr:hypothetical protein [Terriglobia bacterium]